MSEKQNGQEYDFYQAALKAFEVPKMVEAETEESAPEDESLVVQPELVDTPMQQPQEMKKPGSLRRVQIGIALVLAITLLICFWPKKREILVTRGEYWVFGNVVAVEKDHIVLVDIENKRWYVDTTGVEMPSMKLGIAGSLVDGLNSIVPSYGYYWVLYDGEPQATTNAACNWKVTATTILENGSHVAKGLELYGPVHDELLFDLDGDGKAEQWLLFNRSESGSPIQRIVVLSQDDKVKYDILLHSPMAQNCRFFPKDGKLRLAAMGALRNITLDIKLENGTLAVYYGKTKLNVVDQLTNPTAPTMPPTTTGQLIEPNEICKVRFYLFTQAQAEPGHGRTFVNTLDLVITAEEMESFYYDLLNNLPWNEVLDESTVHWDGYFALEIGQERHHYQFTHNGTLYCTDASGVNYFAQLTVKQWNQVMDLMQRCAENPNTVSSEYLGVDNRGISIDLRLKDDGSFAFTWRRTDVDAVIYGGIQGEYAVIGEYIYLATTKGINDFYFESVPNSYVSPAVSSVFVFRRIENGLSYVEELSNQSVLDISDGQIFGDPYAPKELYVTISATDPQTGELLVGDFPKITLSESQSDSLKKLLSEVEWLDADMGGTVPACRFVLQYANGVGEAFGICGTELWRSRGLAKLSLTQWKTLMDIIAMAQGDMVVNGDYSANLEGIDYQLSFGQGRTFEITFGYEASALKSKGQYIATGELVYLWNKVGNTYLMISRNNGLDVVHGLPDGLQFRKYLNFTTLSYDIIVDEMSGLYAEDLSDRESSRLSEIVTNLQWQPKNANPQGVLLGSLMLGEVDWFGANLRSDRTLVDGNVEAKLQEEDWNFLLNVLMEHGKPGPDAVYTTVVGEKNLELCIMGAEFKIIDGENWIVGKCIHFDKTLMLFGDDGQVLVLSVNTNGTLQYHAGLSWLLTWDLPANTKFQPLEDIVPEAA